MTLRVSIEGNEALAAALREASQEVKASVAAEMAAIGVALRGDIVKRIQRGPASGRIYERRGIVHQASAPGEAPMSDTGRLANSIYFTEGFGPSRGVSVQVGSNLVYAKYLEYGTRHMQERPYFTPAANKVRKTFTRRIEAAIKRATQ